MRFKKRGDVAGTADDFHEIMVKQVTDTEACLKKYNRRVCVYKELIGNGVSVTCVCVQEHVWLL
jgi:hypothetical protein